MSTSKPQEAIESVAIIGMAGRFPGAGSLHEFWQNLRDGVESITHFSAGELEHLGIEQVLLSNPRYVRAWGIIEGAELFDGQFFGFSPRDAEVIDPQQRVFLECAWEALEHAGYDPKQSAYRVGVYAGMGKNTYASVLFSHRELCETIGRFQIELGNDKDYISTRVSYKLGLSGPSMTVQTACSTALVAVHLACQGLLNYECDMALAGAVSIRLPQKSGYLYEEGGISSPDGHCRAFDSRAQGVVGGNGGGVIVLKRLGDALDDRDYIHALIRGSAVNNDGSSRVGYTAPSVNGQAEVIASAHAMAGIAAETVTYIEAHGAATPLGDPIEIAALTQAFRLSTDKRNFCAVGAVKTNIGHLHEAAGIAGLIKTVLALKHQILPPTLHFEHPNPEINFESSPFFINTRSLVWDGRNAPRRAGVSSFGLGGTNAHVILEEAPQMNSPGPSRPKQLLLLSAYTDSALERATENLAAHLKKNPASSLPDVAYTLQCGRRTLPHRRMLVCHNIDDAVYALERRRDPRRVLTSHLSEVGSPHVTLMFPGLGDHYVGMAYNLYQFEPVFREHVDVCAEILRPLLKFDLREVLYPADFRAVQASTPTNHTSPQKLDLRKMLHLDTAEAGAASQRLNKTCYTQPAVFVIEYALASLLIEWGVRPQSMIGYSIGEYVAACLSGVLSLDDALFLVARRAQMIEELSAGSMLAIPLPEAELQPFLNQNLSIAAVNGLALCVVSGITVYVDELKHRLEEAGLVCVRVQTSHAFHSQMMRPIADAYTQQVKAVRLGHPQIPYLSNVTGTWITDAEATDPAYWSRHLCQTVCFADGLEKLFESPDRVLLEVGPGQSLCSLAIQHASNTGCTPVTTLSSLRNFYDHQSDVEFLLGTVGQLWLSGVKLDWSKFSADEHRQRVPLPTYPFEGQNYTLVSPKLSPEVRIRPEAPSETQGPHEWVYRPVWKHALKPVAVELSNLASEKQTWLVFVDDQDIGTKLIERLLVLGQNIVTVMKQERFSKVDERVYAINPQERDDYDRLLRELLASHQAPRNVIHLWNLDHEKSLTSEAVGEENGLTGFFSLIYFAQSLDINAITDRLQIWCIANGLHVVESGDEISPMKAAALAPCKVIPQEYANITCRSIDVALERAGSQHTERLITNLLAELGTPSSDIFVAYRRGQRWVQTLEQIDMSGSNIPPAQPPSDGVSLIIGGFEVAGFALAAQLARTGRVRLALSDPAELPPAAAWEEWLTNHDAQDPMSCKIRKVRSLEQLGAEVALIRLEVPDESRLRAALSQTSARFGEINRVIYAGSDNDQTLFASIQEIGAAQFVRDYSDAIRDIRALGKTLIEAKVDHCILLSSLSTVLGGAGSVGYIGANLMLEALAHLYAETSSARWISVNLNKGRTWGQQKQKPAATPGETTMLSEEYLAILQRALSLNVPQVIISSVDLQTRLDKMVRLESIRDVQGEAETRLTTFHSRPAIRNIYVPPRTETERVVADLWRNLLGIAEVGVYDNFFELGGHSLLVVQQASRLRHVLRVTVPLPAFFAQPTVSDLAALIDELRSNSGAVDLDFAQALETG